MNIELILLIARYTHTLIQSTRTHPQETLEFKIDRQMQMLSINPPIYLNEGDKRLLAVTSFECTNSVFRIMNENNSFSISITFHWRIPTYL